MTSPLVYCMGQDLGTFIHPLTDQIFFMIFFPPTPAGQEILFLFFSPPTWKKDPCRDPSSVEYNESCLIGFWFIFRPYSQHNGFVWICHWTIKAFSGLPISFCVISYLENSQSWQLFFCHRCIRTSTYLHFWDDCFTFIWSADVNIFS